MNLTITLSADTWHEIERGLREMRDATLSRTRLAELETLIEAVRRAPMVATFAEPPSYATLSDAFGAVEF